MNEKIRELLYRSLDEKLPDADASLLEQALQVSDQLQQELNVARQIRDAVAADPGAAFEPGFVQRVMGRIESADSLEQARVVFTGALVRLFKPVAAVAAAAVLLLAGWNVVATGEVSPSDEDDAYVDSGTGVLQTPLDALFEEPS